MPVDDQVAVEQQKAPPAGQQAEKPLRTRQSDEGPAILPYMQHFVLLVRKIKRPRLLQILVERANGSPLDDWPALGETAARILPPQSRSAVFERVAMLRPDVQRRLEQAAERIMLLDDEYGVLAVQSLLDECNEADTALLAAPTDRHSRALHLYLLQEYPESGARREQRFDHAERLQTLHRQSKSESYSSHYLGPRGVMPTLDTNIEGVLRERIAALFPQVTADQILIEQFWRRGLSDADGSHDEDNDDATPGPVYALTATFNGSTAHYQQVDNGEVVDHEEPAAMSASFSWEPDSGSLGVFCEDREVRRDLAALFRDVVLACEDEINDMPIREFDLFGFSTPAMLKRLEQERVAGVEKISIVHIKIARPIEQSSFDEAKGRDLIQHLSSTLLIGRDRRDARHIYQLAYDDYGLDDLTGYTLAQVKLVFRMASQPHRRAHNVTVQIAAPNGLNDKSKTEDDRKRVLQQLARIGVLREF
jgi:hypothetical protein